MMVMIAIFIGSTMNANQVQILSAVKKDKTIDNATVIFQKIGESSVTIKSNAQGIATYDPLFKKMESSDTLMLIKKEGYSTLIAKCPCDGLTYALSPVMKNLDGMRIVLNWGSTPSDLDSHLVFPNNNIYFSSKNGNNANLDVDDTDSFGPETITIQKKIDGQKYVYAVHDYSDRNIKDTYNLGKSQATVRVYIGKTLIRTYRAQNGMIGNTWVVFGIDEDGAFHDIERYLQTDTDGKNVVKDLKPFIESKKFVKAANISINATNKAKQLNHKGERIYHEKKLEQAMYLFQDAINLDSEYGQAYSNLGLTYRRLGRDAESIWASRKAIELAHGKNKKTVQASSYYNIGRIYESQNKYQDALNNYKKALQLKEHSAYHQGIDRMKEKLK